MKGCFIMSESSSFSIATTLTEANIDLFAVAQQVIDVLPVVIPVLVTFLAIRKGLSFLLDTLRSA